MENVIKRISHSRIICFLSGALIALAVVLSCGFYQARPQQSPEQNSISMHDEYMRQKGLDKNSPFVTEPADDGSYTVVSNSKNAKFNSKIASAAKAWQKRTGIVFKIAHTMPENKQGVIPIKNVNHYLDKDRKQLTLGTTEANVGVNKTCLIRISQKANNRCGTDIRRVAIHELGHAIGISHNTKNKEDIMSPVSRPTYYKQEITHRDIKIAKGNHRVLMHDLRRIE